MKAKSLYITRDDFEKLSCLLQKLEESGSRDKDYISRLREEIDSARIVPAERIGANVVTMNSRVTLEDLDTCEELTLEIVYPDETDLDSGRISVLAPVGTAILGCKVGDTVLHDVPGGKRKLSIKELHYQHCA